MSDIASITMMDLAGVDTTQVKEVRGVDLPAGYYDFQFLKPEMEDGKSKDGKDLKQLIVKFPLQILACTPTVGGFDVTALIGKQFTHKVAKNLEKTEDVDTFVGMVKAFLIDTGCNGNGTFADVVRGAEGHRFSGKVRLRPNTQDTDADPFPVLVTKKLKALAS